MTKATLTMENGDRIVLELDRAQAPLTVANFIKLAREHFYDGLIFHRVIRGFMIQGGCPQGTGTGGPGYQIKGEFRANGTNNQIRHERGVISMARAMDPDSAGSQFFIMHQNAPHLDGQYAAFGHVTEGMDVVDQIASARTGRQDRPLTEQKIKSITIEDPAEGPAQDLA
ncbi:MAG TPA: peptidylprolyl isomerase [Clostridiales bacterium]|nr:peptidylprolyl isomerase [Clostridiales bacterium]